MSRIDLPRGAVALLTLVLLGAPACTGDEELARAQLARLGFKDIVLTSEGKGIYTFTATDDTGNKGCRGALRVQWRAVDVGATSGCHIPL